MSKLLKALQIMPPKKKAKTEPTQEREHSSNLVWSDDEIELLLGVVQAFASEKEFEGVEWESVKSKYEDIRKEFVTLYDQKGLKEHATAIFTRERIASKIKDLRKKYKKAVDSGRRSGGGRTVATFYDVCNGIWGGCPATKSLEHGVDSTEGFALVQLDDENGEEKNSDEQIAGQNAPPLEPISPEPPVINNDVASVANVDSETENGTKRVPGQKPLIEHLKDKRHSKLSKTKSIENQQLAVMREDLALKKTMITKMEKMDEEHNKTLNKFANTMENLSQAVLNALGGRQAPYPWQQQPLPHQYFQPVNQPHGMQLQPQGMQGMQSEYIPQQSVRNNIDPDNTM